jgi:hypothetical protein
MRSVKPLYRLAILLVSLAILGILIYSSLPATPEEIALQKKLAIAEANDNQRLVEQARPTDCPAGVTTERCNDLNKSVANFAASKGLDEADVRAKMYRSITTGKLSEVEAGFRVRR